MTNVEDGEGICGDTFIGSFMVEGGVKMNSEAYVYFLKQFFLTGTRSTPFIEDEMHLYA